MTVLKTRITQYLDFASKDLLGGSQFWVLKNR